MKFVSFILTFCLIVFFSFCRPAEASENYECKPGINILKGTYHGKNLYFRNSYMGIQKIYLNNKLISDTVGSAFELDLSGCKMDDVVNIKIEYCENSPNPYKVLNPDAIK